MRHLLIEPEIKIRIRSDNAVSSYVFLNRLSRDWLEETEYLVAHLKPGTRLTVSDHYGESEADSWTYTVPERDEVP